MKKLPYILFLLLCLNARAQADHIRYPGFKKTVDKCKYSITYRYRFLQDTLTKQFLFDTQILEIGDSIPCYTSILADRVDSAYYKRKHNHINKQNKDGSDGYNLHKDAKLNANEQPIYENLYINYPAKEQLTVHTGIWYTEYVYEEDISKFDWIIHADTATIIGFKCLRASTTFRGRTYEVWFSPSIPIRKDPWKFNGLPGLILKVNDTKNYFEWIAIGLENKQKKDIYVYKYEKMRLMRTNRKNVMRLIHKNWNDRRGLILAHTPNSNVVWSFTNSTTGQKYKVSHNKDIPIQNFQFPYQPIPELDLINYEK